MSESPANIEAEEALLSACLIDRRVLTRMGEVNLPEEAFFRSQHRKIYARMREIHDSGEDLDAIVLSEALDRAEELEAVGGISEIYRIEGAVDTAMMASRYLEMVLGCYLRRKIVKICQDTSEAAFTGADDPAAVASRAENLLKNAAEESISKDSIATAAELVDQSRREYKEREQMGKNTRIVPVPLLDLRKMMLNQGWAGGELIVIGARPSVGKSSLAGNFAEYAAVESHFPCLIFSFEMTAQDWIERIACSRAEVDSTRYKRCLLREQDKRKLHHSMEQVADAPLYIDDTFSLTAVQMRARAAGLAAKLERQGTPLGMVVVDYLQLVSESGSSTRKSSNREQDVAMISRTCKQIARELNVPAIVLSQLSRDGEKQNREPRLSDLRESGAIEQDADVVILMHKLPEDETTPDYTTVQLDIAKQRNGPIGKFTTLFHKPYTRFQNYAYSQS